MLKSQFEKIVLDEGIIAGSVNLDLISKAEKKLGVVFPNDYVDILGKYGAILLNGREIYGITLGSEGSNEPPLFQSVINETLMRRENNSFFKENVHYVPISDNGYGKIYFLDTKVSPEICIKSYDHGIECQEYSDIYDFILNSD